jgi:hypothetical protein
MVLAQATVLPLYADGGDPPVTVGRLSGVAGTVSVQPAGVNQWSAATYNYPLTTGDRLYADKDGRAEVEMGQTVARVWHDTDLSVTNLTDQITQLGLSQGTLRVRTFGLDPNQIVEVDTPNGAITVMQPGSIRVDAYPGDGGTQVTVNSGSVQITGPSLSQNLGAGQAVRLIGTNPIQVSSTYMPGSDEFDRWSQQRDERILSAQSRQYVNPNTIGSEDLDQNGTWGDAPDYGPIWYPSAVPVGWVPYSMGQWMWEAPWGWTWVDAEPWGFAPFHYGRWAMWGGRWGWVPGPYAMAPIYSPALVGWMGGPGFGIGVGFGFGGGMGMTGWFPLGPGEPFYPWYHCGPGYFGRVNITNINNVTINRMGNIRNLNATNYYNYYHNNHVMDGLHFANRNIATTAMRQSAFASGRRITPQTAIHPTAAQLQHAQWVPHPMVKPTMQSVVPHPVSHVPVSSERPTLLTPHGEQRAVPGAQVHAVPYHALPQQRTQANLAGRDAFAPQQQAQRGNLSAQTRAYDNRTTQSNNFSDLSGRDAAQSRPYGNAAAPTNTQQDRVYNRPQPLQRSPMGNSYSGGRSNYYSPRPLINRNETPAPGPSFQQRLPAMSRDPGRPLDPWQVDNISRGRPAGPAHTQEFPSHPYGSGGGFHGGGTPHQNFSGGRPHQ